jgi:hypothetical protein
MSQTRERQAPSDRRNRAADIRRLLLFALPMATGAALAVNILAGLDLRLAALGLICLGAGCWALALRGLTASARAQLRHRIAVGAVAGALATASYDLARYGLVSIADFSFAPFHVFTRFGGLLLGRDAPTPWLYVAGIAFHVTNGIGFAIGYTVIARRPQWWSAMVFAFTLELCMALLYPSWLRMTALQEFLQVSILGHAVYGLVLGAITRRHAGAHPGAAG